MGDQFGIPVIDEVQYKVSNVSGKLTTKPENFLKTCLNNFKKKPTVFVTKDAAALELLFSLGLFSPQFFSDVGCNDGSVVGVATMEDILKATGKTSTLDLTKIYEVEKAFQDSNFMSAEEETISRTVHCLHSVFVNKILINSDLPIFTANFVMVKLNQQRTNLIKGKNILHNCSIIKKNLDSQLKLKIFSSDPELNIKIPLQISNVKGKAFSKVDIIVVNKSKGARKNVVLSPNGFVYGYYTSENGFETKETDVIPVGEVKTGARPQKRKLCHMAEYRSCLRSLGYKTFDEACERIVDMSAENLSSLFNHLQAFVANDFPHPAECAAMLLPRIYKQFESKKMKKENPPALENLFSEIFPNQEWHYSVTIDDVTLRNSFSYVSPHQEESNI